MRLIDANELIEHVYRDKLDTRELIAQMVENAPTIKEESKTGQWIGHIEHGEMNNLRLGGFGSYFWCSECHWHIDVNKWDRNYYNYCPNCGAKMMEPIIVWDVWSDFKGRRVYEKMRRMSDNK